MKILFLGLASKSPSNRLRNAPACRRAGSAECGMKKSKLIFRNPQSEIRISLLKDCPNRDGMSQKKIPDGHSLSPLQLDFFDTVGIPSCFYFYEI